MLIEQRDQLQADRVVRPQNFLQVAEGAAGVEDVFHHQHIAAFDADVEVLGDLHFPGGDGAGAVALDAQKIHRAVDGNLPDEIRHENPGALQNAHQMRSPALVIAGNRGGELRDARLNLGRIQQNGQVGPEGRNVHVCSPLTLWRAICYIEELHFALKEFPWQVTNLR